MKINDVTTIVNPYNDPTMINTDRTCRQLRAAFDVETDADLLNCIIPMNPLTRQPDIALIPDPPSFIAAMLTNTAQLTASEYASGGDDSFYDYAPDGLLQMQYLQSCVDADLARFNAFMKAYITSIEHNNDDRNFDDLLAVNAQLLGSEYSWIAFQDATSHLTYFFHRS